MFGLGLGYAISNAVSTAVRLCGGSDESVKAAKVGTAMVLIPMDPIGSAAAIAQVGLKDEGSKNAKIASTAIGVGMMAVGGGLGSLRHLTLDTPLDYVSSLDVSPRA